SAWYDVQHQALPKGALRWLLRAELQAAGHDQSTLRSGAELVVAAYASAPRDRARPLNRCRPKSPVPELARRRDRQKARRLQRHQRVGEKRTGFGPRSRACLTVDGGGGFLGPTSPKATQASSFSLRAASDCQSRSNPSGALVLASYFFDKITNALAAS